MPISDYLFTSESVSEGHPDKVCDLISDSIVDTYMAADPHSRVAAETMATTNLMVIAGETRGPDISNKKIEDVARGVIREIGYEQPGFHWRDSCVEVHLHRQSDDIAMGVDAIGNKDEGAGDQGMMFGYACRETDVLMPAPIYFSHEILRSLAQARHSGEAPALGPDSKSQVTLLYANGQPVGATSVVVSTQHDANFAQHQVRELVRPHVEKVLPEGWMCPEAELYVNPTGRFVIGGPDGDCGLTGRKIIVDTYGGAAPHGGGAFSGKDPTKVDRSAAYAARYLAKNVVAAGLAERCTIQLAYAIGVSRPLSVYVDVHGTGNVEENRLSSVLQERVDLSPRGIREHLNLNRPIFMRTAAYGHFGRNPDADGGFSWERCDLVEDLRTACL
ncbi:MAG: S-adenosylmethionine synthase [Alphaproteobacteria bacterium MarineAlpha9_Bin5]|jgi:S-adenosylmethionine synthetase|nr:MAG: S-adenosylmethionine synthase [Alphaproteobacteria bacterium MarineAlpha9_Bin5]HIA22667.1 methionine adenosyltransferase [Alphaproteobacteria bacterium]HIB19914.1 methionine adenosyltransferase [Alphaproteobacteria bacterium]HIB56068.1 methionine adenosyltransferase [Alphaproteobacteria bacterium]HIN92546.1 methionine adenosyltransferase [Alphaproteobacteria bacterium]